MYILIFISTVNARNLNGLFTTKDYNWTDFLTPHKGNLNWRYWYQYHFTHPSIHLRMMDRSHSLNHACQTRPNKITPTNHIRKTWGFEALIVSWIINVHYIWEDMKTSVCYSKTVWSETYSHFAGSLYKLKESFRQLYYNTMVILKTMHVIVKVYQVSLKLLETSVLFLVFSHDKINFKPYFFVWQIMISNHSKYLYITKWNIRFPPE